MDTTDSLIHSVNGRLMPKDPLSFFQHMKTNRYFITFTNTPEVWRDDMIIAERCFADMIICPTFKNESFMNILQETKDILKQRMKYPGVKENPVLEKIAKTWILPTKLYDGPPLSNILSGLTESVFYDTFVPFFDSIGNTEHKMHFVKIDLEDSIERKLVYTLLDSGFRPSLLHVKWSYDVDEHTPTAHCIGHLFNSGYSLIGVENGQYLYMFTEQGMYDITTMKTLGFQNPFLKSILESVSETLPNNISQEKKEVSTD